MMIGRSIPASSTIGIEMQQKGLRRAWRDYLGGTDGPRAIALQTLFGFTPEQMQRVHEFPTAIAWCRYLEDCFEPLLANEYASIWLLSSHEKPRVTSQCWSWFALVSGTIAELKDTEGGIADVWNSVISTSAVKFPTRPGEEDTVDPACMIAVFAVICWAGMIIQPKLMWTEPVAVPCLAIQQLPPDHQGLKISFVNRPIPAVFRNFQKAMTRTVMSKRTSPEAPIVIFVSSINYHSLRTIGKISLKWVDNMSNHLSFNSRTRTLSLFQFPSFCALTTLGHNRGPLFEELARIMFSTEEEAGKDFEFNLQLCQEVVMSYRLLFGQTRASRRLANSILQDIREKHDYDQLLDILCTRPRGDVVKKTPNSLWPASCRGFDTLLQEADSYSSRDDFPILGSRLAMIQEFNLRQQPSKLRDLWRDRRNPLQWYTFWAVLVIGGISNVIAILQLIVAIVAIYKSK